MTESERDAFDEATAEFIAEWRANPTPTRRQWQALREKYEGRANIEALLRYGGEAGWLD